MTRKKTNNEKSLKPIVLRSLSLGPVLDGWVIRVIRLKCFLPAKNISTRISLVSSVWALLLHLIKFNVIVDSLTQRHLSTGEDYGS